MDAPPAFDEAHVRQRGHYKISQVLQRDECEWERVQDFWSDINDGAAPTKVASTHGAGWVLGNIRQRLAERVFEPMYQCRELLTSKEGFQWVEENTKPLVVEAPSHVEDYALAVRGLVLIHGILDISVVGTSCESSLPEDGSKATRVEVGDVFLWRSDLTLELWQQRSNTTDNGNSNGNSDTTDDTVVFFCTMIPASRAPCSDAKWRQAQLDGYLQQRTSADFQAHTAKVWTEEVYRPHWRHYYRTGPPLVTIRQAELYGLLPYDRDHNEMRKAVSRGIRFSEHYEASVRSVCVPQLAPGQQRASVEFLQLTDAKTEHQTLLMGQDKYLGGIPSPCGRYVYGVPGTARQVIQIELSTARMTLMGPEYGGKFKWLRGVPVPPTDDFPSGVCIALPCNAASILKINPDNGDVYTFGGPELEASCNLANSWFYHGGNFCASNQSIYAIPANANRVMKFNPYTDETTFVGPDFGEGLQKWYGGIEGQDGCIYGIPHNEEGVLQIDPRTDMVQILYPDPPFPRGRWKWHGGLRAGYKIYGFPNNADEIVVIDTRPNDAGPKIYTIGDTSILQSGRHRRENRGSEYKYLGGALTLDKRVAYLFPCDAERVLRIDCETDYLSLVGPLLTDGPNKFQNGFAGRDGCLYGIPQRAPGVLQITPQGNNGDDDVVEILDCGMAGVRDKFEGGVMGADDCIYCMPLRAKLCVKVIPGPAVEKDE